MYPRHFENVSFRFSNAIMLYDLLLQSNVFYLDTHLTV